MVTLLDLCVSSLRRGHANLLCIVPILTDDPRRESDCSASRFKANAFAHCAMSRLTTAGIPNASANALHAGTQRHCQYAVVRKVSPSCACFEIAAQQPARAHSRQPSWRGVSLYLRGPCGLMDKALVFGTKDCRFESCQGHFRYGNIGSPETPAALL